MPVWSSLANIWPEVIRSGRMASSAGKPINDDCCSCLPRVAQHGSTMSGITFTTCGSDSSSRSRSRVMPPLLRACSRCHLSISALRSARVFQPSSHPQLQFPLVVSHSRVFGCPAKLRFGASRRSSAENTKYGLLDSALGRQAVN